MRVAACAGIDPIRFYDLTLDEAIIAFKGKVDEWRFYRNGFNLVHCSLVEKRADILKVLPLPFDDEIDGGGIDDDLVEEYNQLREKLNG